MPTPPGPTTDCDETLTALALDCLDLTSSITDLLHRLTEVDCSAPDEAEQQKRVNCTKALWARDALTTISHRLTYGPY